MIFADTVKGVDYDCVTVDQIRLDRRNTKMVSTESARVLSPQDIREFIDEKCSKPTVDRLFFLETKEKEGYPSGIFPIYMEAYAIMDAPNTPAEEKGKLLFQACIIQYKKSEGFCMARVYIRESQIGTNNRIWDKPPTNGLRNDHPWLDTEVVQ